MKKFLTAAVVAACLSIGSVASASQAPTPKVVPQARVVFASDTDAVAARQPLRNILRGLIELERRKNAMLRRIFRG